MTEMEEILKKQFKEPYANPYNPILSAMKEWGDKRFEEGVRAANIHLSVDLTTGEIINPLRRLPNDFLP